MRFATVDSPCGAITVVCSDVGLWAIGFDMAIEPDWQHDPELPAAQQLAEYFSGQRTCFDLQLDLGGTDFQRSVWQALMEIPYGATTSYGAIAASIGRPSASRAVGAANGKNPIAIVVPCHRVIGRDGTLTGYAGGLSRKEALLCLEQQHAQPMLF